MYTCKTNPKMTITNRVGWYVYVPWRDFTTPMAHANRCEMNSDAGGDATTCRRKSVWV